MNLKKTDIRNRTCNYFNDIIKIGDFDLDDILNIFNKIVLDYN